MYLDDLADLRHIASNKNSWRNLRLMNSMMRIMNSIEAYGVRFFLLVFINSMVVLLQTYHICLYMMLISSSTTIDLGKIFDIK